MEFTDKEIKELNKRLSYECITKNKVPVNEVFDAIKKCLDKKIKERS